MMAIALGVDGPTIVWRKLSNSTKFFAHDHMNGIVSQSIWPMSSSAFCCCASVIAGRRSAAGVTMLPEASVVRPSWSIA